MRSVATWRGELGREVGGAFRREGTHVCLWPVHDDVWQKPSQYCKAKVNKLNNKKEC